ncbi:MAG: NAD(P)/FAD-dependent oxidoreductase [Myxococcales bacterium]|nr:NAD(P)/FAD-dependent oxidoreductase [Myxococcales bacterium]
MSGPDVAVIGAGIGGLTTAALLARRGLRVEVFERRAVPGGCCTSASVEGHRFDVAASLFYGFGAGGFNANRRVLDELQAPLDVLPKDPGFHLVLEGRTIPVHRSQAAYLDTLCAVFPSCAAGLRRFYERLTTLYADVLRVGFLPVADQSLTQLARLSFDNPALVTRYLPLLRHTVWSFLQPLLRGVQAAEVRRLRALLDTDLAFGTCATADEVPLLLAVPILMDRHVGGICYPRGGAQALSDTLAAAFERHGGRLRRNTGVRRILVERNRAVGLRLDDGETVHAAHVVSNAGVWNTFQSLLDPGIVPARARRRVEQLQPSFSAFVTCVSVPAELVPAGFQNHTVSIPDAAAGLSRATICYLPSLDDPALAPPGRHALTLVHVAPYERWSAGPGTRAEDRPELDRAWTARALTLAEDLLPGITARGRVLASFSPARLERELGRRFGAVGGPAQVRSQSLHRRSGHGTGIANLHLVGDSTFPGEGVVAVTISGLNCADRIAPRRPGIRRDVKGADLTWNDANSESW